MLDFIKNVFKGTDYKTLIAEGAKIIDVRTAAFIGAFFGTLLAI